MDIFEKCIQYQESRMVKEAGLYPFFRPIESSEGSTVTSNGRKIVMIGSNNYLGLTHDPRVKEAAIGAIQKYGVGCTGSRFLNGNLDLHDELEKRLAVFVGTESALVFSTGFLANLGAISSLASACDIIFSDSENHASIIAGCRAAKATVVKYEHNNGRDLLEQLKSSEDGRGRLIVTDGVFSMTGEIVDLDSVVEAKKACHGSRIYLDDAHGLGVLGRSGRGTADHFGLTRDIDVLMGTFSKSLASIGGFIASTNDVIEFVRHKARALIFSAALPPPAAAAVLMSLSIMESEPERVEALKKNCEKMRTGFKTIGLSVIPSQTPIISIFVGDEGKAFQVVKALFERGVFATPVIYPAVAYGQALLRTSYMATHTEDELDYVLDVFSGIAEEFHIRSEEIDAGKFDQFRAGHYNFGLES